MKLPDKILLLLGSGISIPSKLPSVGEITTAIFTEPVRFDTDNQFHCTNHPKSEFLHNHVPEITRRFLRLIKSHADAYFALRTGEESNYEDIYYLCSQIADDQLYEIDNPAIEHFLADIRSRSEPLYKELPKEPPDDKGRLDNIVINKRLRKLAVHACSLIEAVVEFKLKTPKKIEGLSLIKDFALKYGPENLTIATLNHDLLLESYLTHKGIPYTTGFDKQDGDIRFFDPSNFNANDRIRILKLHGSIDWFRFARNDHGSQLGIAINDDPEHVKLASGKADVFRDGPYFLAGTFNKLYDYGNGVFAEQFFRFHEFFKNHDLIVVSGYGFRDKAINGRLAHWLNEALNHKILILHEKKEELQQSARGAFHNMQSRFPAQVKIHNQWMQDVTLKTLSEQLDGYYNSD